MQYVNLPTSGLKNVNLSSFSIEARNPQNTIDTNFNGSVTLSKLSGNGTMSGTLIKSFVNGIATFNDVQFDIADTYTINASATGLPQVTSGNIVISDAIVYQKITSLNDLTDGEYVIVADGNNAMNNTVTSSKLGKTSVTVLSNQISDATPEIVWTITTDNGNIKTIYNSNSNKFISGTSSTNLTLVDAVSTVGQKWEATFVSNLFRLINQQDTSRGIYYNGTSFGRYATSIVDNSSYFAVSLFKKVYVSTTIWNGSSWSNGTPTNTKDAAINGVYSGAGFVSKSLTVNAGKSVEITSGGAIETGAVTNNGSILIKDGANFNHSSYSGSGAFSLEKATTSELNKYVFWSSPVAGQNMYNLYTSPSPFVMAYNTATDYYDTLANPTTGDFGKGYSVKVPVANGLASFTGTPNNGTQTVTVNNTVNSNGNAYNLIGNPYPSNLDLENFYLENTSNVGQTFYFWSPNIGDNTQSGATATVNPGWAVYNANTTTWSRAASGNNTIIRPGQAFIVKALTTGVVFNNGMRTVSNTGVSFFNKNTASGAEGKYWLQLAMPNQTAFQMAVTYGQGASNAYDNADSKLMSVGNDNIYSIAEGNKLAIQGRANFANTDVVTLGNKHSLNGNYTISLVGKTGIFDNGQIIYLRDKQLDTYTDLTQQDYTFAAGQGEFANRFEIVYQPQGALATVETTKGDLRVYRDGEVFVVENAAKLDKITVLDASGRVVKVLQPNAKKVVVEISAKGMYLFNILCQGKEQVKKVIK